MTERAGDPARDLLRRRGQAEGALTLGLPAQAIYATVEHVRKRARHWEALLPSVLSIIVVQGHVKEVSMARKSTPADADVILKLYDLRRETEIRKARNWWLVEFWPETAEDVLKVAQALGTQENAWFRQVIGYWELAASLVIHGTVDETLFLEPAFSGEMFLIFAKLHPFLQAIRAAMQNPRMLGNMEQVINATTAGQERLQGVEQRVAARRQQRKEGTGRA
jgi:hypothetical protein